jgi:hypothetical protein
MEPSLKIPRGLKVFKTYLPGRLQEIGLELALNLRRPEIPALPRGISIPAVKRRSTMPNIYSGVCLTALFSAIVQEHRRLKGEANQIRAAVEALARPARPADGPALAASVPPAGRS